MSSSQRAEATATPRPDPAGVRVRWRDTEFVLPRASDFPLEALEAEENGKHLAALRLILGEAQYATWRALASTAADAEEFSQVVMEELGVGNP